MPEHPRTPPAAGTFHHRLREAIARSGLTLDEICSELGDRRLALGRSTLSMWQNGLRVPNRGYSLEVMPALEKVLDLPNGWLLDTLEEADAPDRARNLPPHVARLMDEIGAPAALRRLDPRAIHVTVSIGRDGSLDRVDWVQIEKAAATAKRYAIIHSGEPGGNPELLRPVMHAGGRITRILRDYENNTIVVGVDFHAPARKGDLVMLRYSVHDANSILCPEYYAYLRRGPAMATLEARFHPERLPTHVYEVERKGTDNPLHVRRAVRVDDGIAVIARERAAYGLLGCDWRWGPDTTGGDQKGTPTG